MKTLKGYLCGNDPCDISMGANDVVIFSSIEALKKKRTCWKECGIIEIEIKGKVKVTGTLNRKSK